MKSKEKNTKHFQVLSWIFTTELAIKFVGLLPVEFWKTKWNIFDTVIVFISLIEMNLGSSTNFNVSGLRSLRVVSKIIIYFNTLSHAIVPGYHNYNI